jgi:catechol 2,3-dioxygenase-like lactoylglutathione lyase family enzyme
VSLVIFPIEYPKQFFADQWKGRVDFDSTRGHVVDHIGFSFDHLADALETLRKDGVKVTDEIRNDANARIKHAFIEGPDKIRIELIEGHAKKE